MVKKSKFRNVLFQWMLSNILSWLLMLSKHVWEKDTVNMCRCQKISSLHFYNYQILLDKTDNFWNSENFAWLISPPEKYFAQADSPTVNKTLLYQRTGEWMKRWIDEFRNCHGWPGLKSATIYMRNLSYTTLT